MIELLPRTSITCVTPPKQAVPRFRQLPSRAMFYVGGTGPFYKVNEGAEGVLNLDTGTFHTVAPDVEVIPVKTATFETTFSK